MTTIAAVGQGESSLLVEVDETASVLTVPRTEEHTERGPTGFAEVSSVSRVTDAISDVQTLIAKTGAIVQRAVEQLVGKPDKVAAEFGIKFAGEAGVPVL